ADRAAAAVDVDADAEREAAGVPAGGDTDDFSWLYAAGAAGAGGERALRRGGAGRADGDSSSAAEKRVVADAVASGGDDRGVDDRGDAVHGGAGPRGEHSVVVGVSGEVAGPVFVQRGGGDGQADGAIAEGSSGVARGDGAGGVSGANAEECLQGGGP